ncbi:MAG: PP0621 family protein [Burkholderiaceae bacterium]|jgi:hypothetical protein|nr:PP0621 family protein [Burkholderiaceae bacterium]
MGKLLSWVVLIALAWLVIRLFAISQRRRQRSGDAGASDGASSPGGAASGSPRSSGSSRRAIEGEPIVPCAQCGLFVPASDVVRDDGFDYCSTAHRDAHRAQRRAHPRDERR